MLANGAIGGRPAETTKEGNVSLFFLGEETGKCGYFSLFIPEDSHISWIRFTAFKVSADVSSVM